MNEEEYLFTRIKYLEETIQDKNLPTKILINQQKALQNYKKELDTLLSDLS